MKKHEAVKDWLKTLTSLEIRMDAQNNVVWQKRT